MSDTSVTKIDARFSSKGRWGRSTSPPASPCRCGFGRMRRPESQCRRHGAPTRPSATWSRGWPNSTWRGRWCAWNRATRGWSPRAPPTPTRFWNPSRLSRRPARLPMSTGAMIDRRAAELAGVDNGKRHDGCGSVGSGRRLKSDVGPGTTSITAPSTSQRARYWLAFKLLPAAPMRASCTRSRSGGAEPGRLLDARSATA